MELTQLEETTTCRIVVSVDEGVVIKSVHNKDMRITQLVLVYIVADGEWVSRAVTAFGQRLKQDGAVGQRKDERLFGWPDRYPYWVEQAAEHYRPKGPAPYPAVPTCVLDVGEPL